MGVSHITAALVANRGQLYLQHFRHLGLMMTQAASDFITDSAAAATAIATGTRTRNQALGVNESNEPLTNIREIVAAQGLKTGVVACCPVTEATPASFVAHHPERFAHEDIALDYLFSDIDFFLGSGLEFFSDRTDGLELLPLLREQGYQVVHSAEDLSTITTGKVAGLLGQTPAIHEGRADMLRIATREAIRLLSAEDQGFFLVVEGSQIDWGAHDNDTAYVVQEVLDFDQLVGEALQFAATHPDTLVVVASDHETGGMAIHDGDIQNGQVAGAFSTTMHTGVMVPVFAYGPGASHFQGMYPNTALFHHMLTALAIPCSP